MPRHGLELLALLAVSPAQATLLEYSFEGQLHPFGDETVGLEIGGTISGGFLWGDTAPKSARKETQSGPASASTYDMSNLLWWVILGDQTFRVGDDDVTPTSYYVWDRTMHGDRYESDGHVTRQLVLTSSEVQVVQATNAVRQVFGTTIWDSWWAKLLAYGLLVASVVWQGRRVVIGTAASTAARQHVSTATARQSPRARNGAKSGGAQEASPTEAREANVEAQLRTTDESAQLVPNSEGTSVDRIEQLEEAVLDPERGDLVPVETQDQIGSVAVIEEGEPSIAANDGSSSRADRISP